MKTELCSFLVLALVAVVAKAAIQGSDKNVASDCKCACTMEYSPVCAKPREGPPMTFGNKCAFACAQCLEGGSGDGRVGSPFQKLFDGECYVNPNSLLTRNKRWAAADEDAASRSRRAVGRNGNCEKMCSREYNPVCGSDGEEYANPCEFQVARCRMEKYGAELRAAAPESCNSVGYYY